MKKKESYNIGLTKEEIDYRGRFISVFIDIEFAICDLISTLLVGNNILKINILEFVTPNIMLDRKITLLSQLLKKKIPPLFKRNEKDFERLKKLTSLRNNFAHKIIEVEVEDRKLHFMSIDNGKRYTLSYTFDDLHEKYELLKNIVIGLRLLHSEIIST